MIETRVPNKPKAENAFGLFTFKNISWKAWKVWKVKKVKANAEKDDFWHAT